MIGRLSGMELGLLAAIIVCVGLFIYESSAPYPRFEPPLVPAVAPSVDLAAGPKTFAAPPIDDFSEIDVRPLFSPLRKPQAEVASVDAARPLALPPPPDLVVAGIVIGPDDRFAILKMLGATVVRNVHIGEDVAGWKLVKVEAEYIVLRAGSSDREIGLRPKSGDSAVGGIVPLPASVPFGIGGASTVPPGLGSTN